MSEEYLGKVTHFYTKICVAVLSLERPIAVGDEICIRGRTTDFCQPVRSLQIDHRPVPGAAPGEDVALQVLRTVRRFDRVYKLLPDA